MKLKKLLSAVVVGALSLTMLVGCGNHADTKEMMKIFNDALSYNDTTFQKDLADMVKQKQDELNKHGLTIGGETVACDIRLSLDFKTNTAKNSSDLNNAASSVLTQLQGAYKDGETVKSLIATDAVKKELTKTVVKDDSAIYVMSYVKLRDFESDTFNSAKTLLQMSEMFANVPNGIYGIGKAAQDKITKGMKEISQSVQQTGKLTGSAALKTGDTMQVGFAEGKIGDEVYLISVMKLDVDVTLKGSAA